MPDLLPFPGPERRAPTDATLDSVVLTLTAECRLLTELTGVLQRQRAAVLTSDLGALDDSIFAARRILLTLDEVRTKRRMLNRLMEMSDDLSVWELEEVLGERMTEELRHLCRDLGRTARLLSHEVEANQHLLSAALRTA